MAKSYPHGQCKAKSKTTGKRCAQGCVPGRDVCRFHGGLTPRGFALPQTTHGRYSKDLPTRLAGKYLEAQADTELLNLRSEIALIDARTSELIKQIDTGESGRIWQEARQAHKELDAAMRSGNTAATAMGMVELDRLIRAGIRQYAVWGEIRESIEQRRKLVESEHKWMVQNQQMITSERAMLLIGAIVSIIKDNIDDLTTLAAISTSIGNLITVEAS